MKSILTTILLAAIFSITVLAQPSAQFIDLGPGGAAKVSNNGIYVCGNNYPAPAFIWSETTGRNNLNPTNYSEAFGVSDNGIVAGSFIDSNLIAPNGNPTLRAGYNQNGVWDSLPGYPGYPVLDEMSYNYGYGISADGSIIVGMQWLPTYKAEACYWDASGIHMLGRTGGGSSRANDVAATPTGFRIVGWDGEANGPDRRAFYWDPAPHYMGGYDTTYPAGQCEGLNSDGSKIVGGSVGAPFIWSEATGMEWITTNYLNYASYAKDISDNNIVIGYVSIGVGNYQAFIKRPEWQDILFLKDYLIDSLGITGISDWYFPFANSISADGLTMTGTAYPPSGGSNAYVVKFENPTPVELTSFTANYENEKVMLNWITASEVNNRGFEVERKDQTSGWNNIGFVSGNGTITRSNSYNFTDDSVVSNKYSYRLKQIDLNGTFKYSNVIEVNTNIINEFMLNQNYPNPFNPTTKINFSIPRTSNVKLIVYNTLGEKVATLIDGVKNEGSYETSFNGAGLASGIYVYRLEAQYVNGQSGSFISSKKMILIK
jgi:Secretion system C-terminal sorting domain